MNREGQRTSRQGRWDPYGKNNQDFHAKYQRNVGRDGQSTRLLEVPLSGVANGRMAKKSWN